MARYLTFSQIESGLGCGKSVEQLLAPPKLGHIAWLELRPNGDKVQLWHYDVIDEGNADFADLYSFTPSDGEWPDNPVSEYENAFDAMADAVRLYGASCETWLNQFLIQDEYLNYRYPRSQSNR